MKSIVVGPLSFSANFLFSPLSSVFFSCLLGPRCRWTVLRFLEWVPSVDRSKRFVALMFLKFLNERLNSRYCLCGWTHNFVFNFEPLSYNVLQIKCRIGPHSALIGHVSKMIRFLLGLEPMLAIRVGWASISEDETPKSFGWVMNFFSEQTQFLKNPNSTQPKKTIMGKGGWARKLYNEENNMCHQWKGQLAKWIHCWN